MKRRSRELVQIKNAADMSAAPGFDDMGQTPQPAVIADSSSVSRRKTESELVPWATRSDHSLDNNPRVVFCHIRKSGGTAIVRALQESSCKLPLHHRNGKAWTGPRSDPNAQIYRLWQMKRSEWDEYLEERVYEDRTTVVLEWNSPSFLQELSRDPSYEVFTCLRDPYTRFCSEFFFHDAFHVAREAGRSESLVPENRVGVLASDWVKQTLYWNRDIGESFPVAINRPNYLVRWFCGLFDQPDLELGEEHLEKALTILEGFQGVLILGSSASYSLLRRYNFAGRLERMRANTNRRSDLLLDISREEFAARNSLDYRLFEFARECAARRLSIAASTSHKALAENQRFPEQDAIMRGVDVVVALKERGALVGALLEALSRLYRPRRLIVVCASSEVSWLEQQMERGRWIDMGTPIEVVDEDCLWQAAPLGLTRQEMEASFNASIVARNDVDDVDIAAREFGWYLQQCIKLGIGLLMPSISEDYIVWDADLFPLRRWKVCDLDATGKPEFWTAVLQRAARPGNAYEYVRCLRASTGLEPARPVGGGTFVTHHMAFNKTQCRELLGLITERVQASGLCGPVDCRGRWPLAILGLSHSFPRFSEYLTYASFLEHKQKQGGPHVFNYHAFSEYGMGGLRMRDGARFVEQFIEDYATRRLLGDGDDSPDNARTDEHEAALGALSADSATLDPEYTYDDVLAFAERYYTDEGVPPYLQIEHVGRQSLELQAQPRAWEYYRAYVNGDALVLRDHEEATAARRKVLERRALWWKRFDQAGCLFVHVPKNAGTTVESFFLDGPTQSGPTSGDEHQLQSQHFTAMELRDDRFATFEHLFKFCIVRNPYERFLSAYRYLHAGGNGKSKSDLAWSRRIVQLGSLPNFISHYFGERSPIRWQDNELPTHFVPQHVFVCAEDGTLLVDAYEDMDELAVHGLERLVRRGLPIGFARGTAMTRPLPWLRKTPVGEFAPLQFTQETADMVYAAYEQDFTTFHFARDSWLSQSQGKFAQL